MDVPLQSGNGGAPLPPTQPDDESFTSASLCVRGRRGDTPENERLAPNSILTLIGRQINSKTADVYDAVDANEFVQGNIVCETMCYAKPGGNVDVKLAM